MSIKDAVLAMPVWKAAAIAAVGSLLLLFLIEIFFVKFVFSTINHSVTRFEQVAKDDRDDFEKGLSEFDERREYDRAMSEYNSADMFLYVKGDKQEIACYHYQNIARFHAMQKMAYVKKHPHLQESLSKSLVQAHARVKEAMENEGFNPALCEGKPA